MNVLCQSDWQADDIVRIYEAVVRANVVPVLVRLMDPSNLPQIQYEAIRAVTFFAPGNFGVAF